jgi:hypothetical protein
MTIPNDYSPLLHDIRNGDTYMVCDGSFHPTHKCGAAAWIIEGKTSKQQMTGRILSPGVPNEQSAYRSELAGLLAGITVLNTIAKYHNISPTITMHCDCKTGVKKAFGLQPVLLHDSSSDLLKAIHYELRNTPIQWWGTHVKGHQDQDTPIHLLDRPSQLNIQADHLAKEFLEDTATLRNTQEVCTYSWSLKIDDTQVAQDIDRKLYDRVHSNIAKQYCIKKDRISEDTVDSVLWPRLGEALNKMPIVRRHFCSKHTSGMCGMGKFQKIWKLRESDACPYCGLKEDSLHVWLCKHPSVVTLWEQSLQKLNTFLRKLDTYPNLTSAILYYLQTWRADSLLQPLQNDTTVYLLGLQDSIGSRQFFEGWLHSEWELLQEKYYKEINSRCSAKRWTIAVITRMWEIAWDIWEYRNEVLHKENNYSTTEDAEAIDLRVKTLWDTLYITGLLPKDLHLANITLTRLLQFPKHQKKEWLHQASLALDQAKS